MCIPEDVIGKHVMSFLNSRDLLNIIQVSKYMQQSLTIPIAVKAVLMKGWYGMTSMEDLYKLCQKRSIYPPDPERILRIGEAKRCEFCLEGRVKHVRKGYGVVACWKCTNNKRRLSRRFYKDRAPYTFNPTACQMVLDLLPIYYRCYDERKLNTSYSEEVIKSEIDWAKRENIPWRRTEQYGDTNTYIRDRITYFWAKQIRDKRGNRIGAIVTYDWLINLCEQVAHPFGSTSPHECVDEFLENIGNPPYDHPGYNEIIQAYELNINLAKERFFQNKDQQALGRDRYNMRRIKTAEKFILRLKNELDDPAISYLLNYRVNENFRWFRKNKITTISERPIKMSKWWIECLLNSALKCPSKLNALAIKQLATEIKRKANNTLSSGDNASLIVSQNRNGVIEYDYSENYLAIICHKTSFRMHDSLSMSHQARRMSHRNTRHNRNFRRV